MNKSFEILGINHLGMVAKDIAKARWFFGEILGLANMGSDFVETQKVDTLMYGSTTSSQCISSRLEFLEARGSEGVIGKYKLEKGGGIHHIALGVNNIDAAAKYLQDKGIALLSKQPEKGAHNTRIVFVHPKITGGFLVELVEEAVEKP